MELIQMTAAYSNAVFLAVLTNVTSVANKLDMPILRPVQPAHVRHFVCDPRKDHIGGWMTLTNGYKFWFDNGHVDSMDSDSCYFHLQDPDEIPRFYGTSRITEAEAVQIARETIRKLGYNLPWLKTEKPVVEQARTAPQREPNVVPRFRVTWKMIEFDGLTTYVEIEINTDAKRVEMYTLGGRPFWRKQPNIPQPPAIPEPPPAARRYAPLLESQRAEAEEICGKATEMARRLGLPIKYPIRTVDIKEIGLGFWQGDFRGTIRLTNRYSFSYKNGHITAFYGPDSDTTSEWVVDPHKIYGKVRYTKEQIREFATKQVRKLGYPDSAVFFGQPAAVLGGPSENSPGDARYRVRWRPPGGKSLQDDPEAQFTEAEVNGLTLQLESLWLRSTNLYKPSIIKPKK